MVTVWWLDLKLKSKICSQLKTIHSQSPKLGKFCLFFSNFPVALLLICSNLREAAFVLIIGLLSEYYKICTMPAKRHHFFGYKVRYFVDAVISTHVLVK